jgi:Flp pilus assembly protein TadG
MTVQFTLDRDARSSRGRSGERGAELVEFALVLPLLLVVFGGIIDFGLMLQRHQVLSNAAREGARLAVLPGYEQADVELQVTRYVRTGIADPAATPIIPPLTMETITPPTGPPFQVVRVDVSYTSNFLVLGPIVNLAGGNWTLGSSLTLQAASTMRVEGTGGGS